MVGNNPKDKNHIFNFVALLKHSVRRSQHQFSLTSLFSLSLASAFAAPTRPSSHLSSSPTFCMSFRDGTIPKNVANGELLLLSLTYCQNSDNYILSSYCSMCYSRDDVFLNFPAQCATMYCLPLTSSIIVALPSRRAGPDGSTKKRTCASVHKQASQLSWRNVSLSLIYFCQ